MKNTLTTLSMTESKEKSSLRGGTTKQSFMLVILAIKIASSAEKAFSQ
ncbi:hypothetical protein QFZ20_001115 [Flavobacterium sp. W4I14]|nr:hypothetical protein [Flavobacterium sp. W4I14]